MSGMGGFLQSVVSGYGGLRLYPERVEFDRPRVLPDTTEMALRGIGKILSYIACHKS